MGCRVRHSVRAVVVNQNGLVGNSGGQRTARPTIVRRVHRDAAAAGVVFS